MVLPMTRVTLQAIEGLERGQVFRDLEPPISLGREDENTIRLNDERVSRFHAKIQVDEGQLIFTDLGSTNGSRVNGIPAHMHVLQIGDQISIGRCLLVVGSDEQLARFFAERRPPALRLTESGQIIDSKTESSGGMENSQGDAADSDGLPFLEPPPPLPNGLSLLQKTLLSDYIAYVHGQLGEVIGMARQMELDGEQIPAEMNDDSPEPVHGMLMDWSNWQQLIHLEIQLSRHLKNLADPDE